MGSTDHQVIIAGAGPTGLMLAAELRLAGIDIVVIERRSTRELVGSRAGGLHARSLEILDQRGIVGRFLAEGQVAQTTGFAGVRFDLSGFPTRHPYGLGLWQNHIERLLADRADELAVPVRRGVELTGFTEDASGVEVALSSGETLRGAWLVGCDGGRSLVRKLAGIGFPGSDPTTSAIIGEMEMTETPEFGVHHGPFGIYSFGREKYEMVDGRPVFAKEGPVRVLLTEPQPGATGEPSFEELRVALVATCGTDYGAHSPAWLSRFTDASHQAEAYRKGRVLLAGDAAHIHAPDGGQGLNTGLQDAVNLGWKLALVARGLAPETLLDTYHAERHPIGARVLRLTMAAVALRREDDRTTALRDTMAELLGFEAPRQHLAAVLSGLEIRYDLGPGHPLLGRRMPDRDLQTAQGTRTVCSLLHEARPVLIDFGTPGGLEIAPWADRVPSIIASSPGPWELPALGPVAAPAAVLVRPDGYVAWVGEGGDTGLADALTTWSGPPTN